MKKLIAQDATERDTWDSFITQHSEANFLQAWAWGEFHRSRGKTVIQRYVIDESTGRPLAAYVGQVETAKRGKYLAIAGGPITDWGDEELTKFLFRDITAQAKRQKCVFVRIRPQLEDSPEHRRLFEQTLGLKPAPMYLSVELAGVLDLTKTEDEILANASQRLRRALRKGKKEGITIESSVNPEDIKQFYQIELETAKRHGFVEFSEDFLEKQFRAFAKYGQVKLYTAKYQGEILAQNFMIFYGNEASYHYGVSTALGTKHSGAPLLHMQAMRDARERGIKRYNFWGITAVDDTKHRFYGVSQFKRGFGVSELPYLHAHDIVLRPFHYRLNYIFEKIRAKLRHV